MRTTFRTLRAAAPAVLLLLATPGCGDDPMLELDDRVDLELFTEIEEVPEQFRDYTQRATLILSPTLSREDVDLITRVRIIDPFEQDWVLTDAADFVAGDRGWELVAERSANRDFRSGPWRIRMVVENQGLYTTGHPQRFGAVGAVSPITSLSPEGVVSIRWSSPPQIHDWTVQAVHRAESGDETVLDQLSGQGAGGGTFTVGFDVDPETFEEPDQLLYRMILVNSVSRRVVYDVLEPSA